MACSSSALYTRFTILSREYRQQTKSLCFCSLKCHFRTIDGNKSVTLTFTPKACPFSVARFSNRLSCRYVPEGNMTACGLDYLNRDWFSRSYIIVYSLFVYFLPLSIIIYSYVFIVKVNLILVLISLIGVFFEDRSGTRSHDESSSEKDECKISTIVRRR